MREERAPSVTEFRRANEGDEGKDDEDGNMEEEEEEEEDALYSFSNSSKRSGVPKLHRCEAIAELYGQNQSAHKSSHKAGHKAAQRRGAI